MSACLPIAFKKPYLNELDMFGFFNLFWRKSAKRGFLLAKPIKYMTSSINLSGYFDNFKDFSMTFFAKLLKLRTHPGPPHDQNYEMFQETRTAR